MRHKKTELQTQLRFFVKNQAISCLRFLCKGEVSRLFQGNFSGFAACPKMPSAIMDGKESFSRKVKKGKTFLYLPATEGYADRAEKQSPTFILSHSVAKISVPFFRIHDKSSAHSTAVSAKMHSI